jgi:cation diffusion facilitator CzcD-associated flavoprotein CzcO
MKPSERTDVEVAIVGSGFSGICMGVLLREAGIESFVLLESGDDVGGTWRENTYPGAACDVPSHLYSFSFAPNPRWSRAYSPQGEILEYLRRTALQYGVTPHVRFGSFVDAADFDEASGRWTVRTRDGHVVRARSFVLGNGALHLPSLPDIRGRESYTGRACHTAKWDHSLDLTGKTVGVIGTGASAIQVVPAIAPKVKKLHLFQRTPAWVAPRNDHAYSERAKELLSRHPHAHKLLRGAIYTRAEATALAFLEPRAMKPLEWLAKRHIEAQVRDPALRKALTPKYRMGCKRILVSDDYYPAVCRPNVELVTTGIDHIEAAGVATVDGVVRPLDVLVYATGFDVAGYLSPISITGLGDRSLADTWQRSPSAYLGITMSGFPNMFALMGPNTGLGHNSMIYMIEAQARYAVQGIRAIRDRKLRYLDVREDVQREFTAEVDEKMKKTVWATGCTSWYLAGGGRNSTLWPGFTFDYARRTRKLDLDAFTMVGEARRDARETKPSFAVS